jgi:hypothetical protein
MLRLLGHLNVSHSALTAKQIAILEGRSGAFNAHEGFAKDLEQVRQIILHNTSQSVRRLIGNMYFQDYACFGYPPPP